MNNRRRLMMGLGGEGDGFPSQTVWVRLDLLKNMITTWDTTIINSQNPVNRGTAFPIYAVASKQNISEGYSYSNLVWFANDPTLVLTPANGNDDKCRFRLSGYGTISTYYSDEMGTSLDDADALTSRGWTPGLTITAYYTSSGNTTSMSSMCTYYNAKADECYVDDIFAGNPVYFYRYQYNWNPTNYAVLIDQRDWNTFLGGHTLTLGSNSSSINNSSLSIDVNVYDKASLITTALQSDFTVVVNNASAVSTWSYNTNGYLTLSVTANTGTSDRTIVVTISYLGSSAQFTIYQSAPVNFTISLTSTGTYSTSLSYSMASNGGLFNVYCKNNSSDISDISNVTVSGDGTRYSAGGSNITVSIASNSSTSQVTKYVYLTYGGQTRTITVTQAAASNTLTISPSSYTFDAGRETVSVTTYLNGSSVSPSNVSVSTNGITGITTTNSGNYKKVTVPSNVGIRYDVYEDLYSSSSIIFAGNKVTILSPGHSKYKTYNFNFYSTGSGSLTLRLTPSSESNYDFGAIGKLDTEYTSSLCSASSVKSSSNVWAAKSSGTSAVTASFSNISAGLHYITLIYTKDGSANSGNDNAVFTVDSSTNIAYIGNSESRSGSATFSYNGSSATFSISLNGTNMFTELNTPNNYYIINAVEGGTLSGGTRYWPIVYVESVYTSSYTISVVLYPGFGNAFYDILTGQIVFNTSSTDTEIKTLIQNLINDGHATFSGNLSIGNNKHLSSLKLSNIYGLLVSF